MPSMETKPTGKLPPRSPSWDQVYSLASSQSGWFTVGQAHDQGFSDQLLAKHVRSGLLRRGQRGIYRLVRFPPSEHEDLVVAWLWSRQIGVISHETALQLHQLSDAMPSRIHLTLPAAESRSARAPSLGVRVHFADIPAAARTWMGPVPVTTPARTVCDVAADSGDEHIVETAIDEGIRRRVFGIADVAPAAQYVASFGPPWASRYFPEATDDWDRWFVHPFSGESTRQLASDWTDLADDVVRAHGGRITHRAYFRSSQTIRIDAAWPNQPAPESIAATRAALAEALSWQR